jgi:SAM-dependent methyltransferase
MPSPSLETFARYAATYEPFPWENAEEGDFQAADVKGKHAVLVSLVRFWKVMASLKEHCPDFQTIVDVGPYPGSMMKMLKHFFPQHFEYWGVGLGFTAEYRTAMARLGGECFETELDPDFATASDVKPWPIKGANCALLLDVIEHLTNPIPCLDAINRSLRPGGTLIVTTDNLTSFANTYQMLRRGRSPNIHPLRSSLFYQGEWRPHFQEFTREELAFYLDKTGFAVVCHEYFERRQGDYYIDAAGIVGARERYTGLRGAIQRACMRMVSHLKDHQIVVASKVRDFDEISMLRSKSAAL